MFSFLDERLKCERIPFIYRGGVVAADPKSRNFAVIQYNPHYGMMAQTVELGSSNTVGIWQDLGNLLSETSDADNVHDVIFKVG